METESETSMEPVDKKVLEPSPPDPDSGVDLGDTDDESEDCDLTELTIPEPEPDRFDSDSDSDSSYDADTDTDTGSVTELTPKTQKEGKRRNRRNERNHKKPIRVSAHEDPPFSPPSSETVQERVKTIADFVKQLSDESSRKNRTRPEDGSDSEDSIDIQLRNQISGKLIDGSDIETESDVDSDCVVVEYDSDMDNEPDSDHDPVGTKHSSSKSGSRSNSRSGSDSDSDAVEGYVPILLVPKDGYDVPRSNSGLVKYVIGGLRSRRITVVNNNDFFDFGTSFKLTGKMVKVVDDANVNFEKVMEAYSIGEICETIEPTIYRINDTHPYEGCLMMTFPPE